MEVQIQLTANDYSQLNKLLLRRVVNRGFLGVLTKVIGSAGVFAMVWGLITLIRSLSDFEYPPRYSVHLGTSLVGWGLAAVIVAFFGSIIRRRQVVFGEDSYHLRPMLFQVADEGLKCSTELMDASYPWRAISKIDDDGQTAYVHLLSQQAIPFPARCFKDREAFEAFVKEVSRRVSDASRKQEAPT